MPRPTPACLAGWILAGLLGLGCVVLVGAYASCRIRGENLRRETVFAVPTLAWIIDDYLHAYQADGQWPAPGTITDDSSLEFVGTRRDNDGRVDLYRGLLIDRTYEIHLTDDGHAQAFLVDQAPPPTDSH